MLEKIAQWHWYAKQWWKLQEQIRLLEAEINYSSATTRCCYNGGIDCWCEHDSREFSDSNELWADRELKKMARLMDFAKDKTGQEIIEMDRPYNIGGVRDIQDLEFPPHVGEIINGWR